MLQVRPRTKFQGVSLSTAMLPFKELPYKELPYNELPYKEMF